METIAGLFPQILVKFLPVLIFSNQEFDSRFDPARQPSAVATTSSSVFSVRDIFMRCLARSRSFDSQISQSAPPAELPLAVYLDLPKVSFRPSGCLRQATRPAPAGTFSPHRVPVRVLLPARRRVRA